MKSKVLTSSALTTPQKMANTEVPRMKIGATDEPKNVGNVSPVGSGVVPASEVIV